MPVALPLMQQKNAGELGFSADRKSSPPIGCRPVDRSRPSGHFMLAVVVAESRITAGDSLAALVAVPPQACDHQRKTAMKIALFITQNLYDLLNSLGEFIDLFASIVKSKRCTGGCRHARSLHHRLCTMMSGIDGRLFRRRSAPSRPGLEPGR